MADHEIVACAVEPEFLTVSRLGSEAAIINIALARVILDGKETTAKVSLQLVKSDMNKIVRELSW